MKKIGLVVAMEEETGEIYKTLGSVVKIENKGMMKVTVFEKDGIQLFLIGSGIGEISAAIAATTLITEYNVEAIINFGVVGSISGKYKAKDVVLVDEIVHYDFTFSVKDKNAYGKYAFNRDSYINKLDNKYLQIGKSVLSELSTARLATGDKFIDSSEFKNELLSSFGADICDMESMGIYIACRNWRIPLFMIKAVSDDADENAQISFEEIIGSGITYYIDAVNRLTDYLKSV